MIPDHQSHVIPFPVADIKTDINHHLLERGGIWYVNIVFSRKRYLRSTGFSVDTRGESGIRSARKWRDKFISHLKAGRLDVLEASRMKAAVVHCTIGDLLAKYLEAVSFDGVPSMETARNNAQALRKIVSDALGIEPDKVDSRSTDVLTAELLEDWARMKIDPVKDDREAADSARRSVRSYIRQARSVFKRTVTRCYRNLSLPNMTEFLRVLPCSDPAVVRQEYTPLELEILEKRGAELKGAADDLYLVWLLGFNLALRAGEMAAARWSWFMESDGIRQIHVCDRPAEGFYAKGFAGWVPVHDDVWAEIQRLRRPGDEYILPGGNDTNRYDLVNRTFATWMRAQGWTRRHCSHELRAYRGDKWRKELGADVCQDWMRHASIQTQSHYVTRHTVKPAIR